MPSLLNYVGQKKYWSTLFHRSLGVPLRLGFLTLRHRGWCFSFLWGSQGYGRLPEQTVCAEAMTNLKPDFIHPNGKQMYTV